MPDERDKPVKHGALWTVFFSLSPCSGCSRSSWCCINSFKAEGLHLQERRSRCRTATGVRRASRTTCAASRSTNFFEPSAGRCSSRRLGVPDSGVHVDVRMVDRAREQLGREAALHPVPVQHDRAVPDGDVHAVQARRHAEAQQPRGACASSTWASVPVWRCSSSPAWSRASRRSWRSPP
jgi:hypothetical protein